MPKTGPTIPTVAGVMKHYHKNPRQITKARQEKLTETLQRLGDISGIVHNLETNEIIGGNQRMTVFADGQTEIVQTLDQADEQGTVAWGFIVWHNHRFSYRQVRWTPELAEEANIVANMSAGTWDSDVLANQWDLGKLREFGFDENRQQEWKHDLKVLDTVIEAQAVDLDVVPPVKEAPVIHCPKCGFGFASPKL